MAALNGDMTMVLHFAQRGISIRQWRSGALGCAAGSVNIDLVSYFLNIDADVNAIIRREPLSETAIRGDMAMLLHLVVGGANLHQFKDWVLCCAVKKEKD